MAVKNKFRVIEPEMNYPYQLGRNEQVLCQVLCGFSYDFGVTVIRHQNADAMVLASALSCSHGVSILMTNHGVAAVTFFD